MALLQTYVDDEGQTRVLQSRWSTRAEVSLTRLQRNILIGVATGCVFSLVFWTVQFLTVAAALVALAFSYALVEEVAVIRDILRQTSLPRATAKEMICEVTSSNLPSIAVLVPVYKESKEMLRRNMLAMNHLAYQWSKLQILYLVEQHDPDTRNSLAELLKELGPQLRRLASFRIFDVSPGGPKNKPNALNMALMTLAESIIGVYDTEDEPAKDQLLQVAVAFKRAPPCTYCVQCLLAFAPIPGKWITGPAAVEYTAWFRYYLPHLIRRKRPVPLGGTSNFFNRNYLLRLGGWEPLCVTEDREIGIKAAIHGYTTEIIDSVTWEIPTSKVSVFIPQRSRWEKGTWQVLALNMRNPLCTLRKLGVKNFLAFLGINLVKPVTLLLNPICMLLLPVYWLTHAEIYHQVYLQAILILANLNWIVGNFLFLYILQVAARKQKLWKYVKWTFFYPFYYMLVSGGEWYGLWQFLTRPASEWKKTSHELSGKG